MTVNVRKAQPLPDLNDPVIDRRRRFTPTWYRWIKPLLNSTVDLKVNLEATDAQVTTNTAAITTEASVRASADSALATQINTLTATVNDNAIASSAAISSEQTARLDADTALTESILTLTATVNGNTASIQNEQSARVQGDNALTASLSALTSRVGTAEASIYNEQQARISQDGVLAQSISTVSTTVGENTSSITTLSQSVDGVRAQWGVAITQNGAVSGLVRLDGGTSQSTFTVVADRFVVVNPNTPSDALQLFTTGSLAGAPGKVGVNAFFILDGTILARHLAVQTLSAITADVGTVTAGKLQSADGKMVIDLDAKTITITT